MRAQPADAAPDPADALSDSRLIRRMLGLAWRYRWGCIKVLSVQLSLLILGLLGLGLMGLGVDVLRHHVTPTAKPPRWPFGLHPPADWPVLKVLGAVAAAILLFALVRSVLTMLYTIWINRLVQGQIVVELRSQVYATLQRLSFRFFDDNATGSIINRVTGDVQAVRMFVDGVIMPAIVLVLSLAVYLVYMVRIHPGLTAACLATTPLLWLMTSRFSRAVQPAYRLNRELFDRQILRLSEAIQGVHVVKGFARQSDQIERFAADNRAVRDHKQGIFARISVFNPLVTALTHLNIVVMLAYGGWLVVQYERAPVAVGAVGLSVGQFLVFTGLLQQFSGQVANIANIANSMQQSLTGARRVFEVLDSPIEIASSSDAARMPRARGAVRFERVTFGYEAREPVLHDVDFAVEPGQCVAILGPTGSGKTTLLSLIPRFYDPAAGRVLVDGVDARRIDLQDLRRSIGIVFQESFLFSTTVAENIAFGRIQATREQVERAARIAAAHDFIMAMPKGYDTVLRQGGTDLSGGQRQRLAIARALLLEPAILLLDDPTAAVDPETEGDILEAMDHAMEGRTTFIVTHRLSALRRADWVIVLDDGRIAQRGTHEELMRAVGHYRWVADLQLPDADTSRLLRGEGSL